MKNMKTHLTRLLVVFTLITVLLSATLIPSFAAPAGSDPVLSGSEYGISYDNGVYTLSIDAERLAEILSSKSFDKETLRSVMPEAVYNLFLNRDAESAKALLADLSKNASLGQLKEDLPIDYVINSFTTEELMNMINIDKLLDIIDIKAIIASIPAEEIPNLFIEGMLEELLKSLDFSGILTNEKLEELLKLLTTEEITAALKPGAIDNLVRNGVVDLHGLMTKEIIQNLFDEEGIITDEEIKELLHDPDVIDEIIKDEKVVNELLHHPDFLADIAAHPEVINDLVTDEVIVEVFLKDGILDSFITSLTAEQIKNIVFEHNIDISDLITPDVLSGLDSSVIDNIISNDDITKLAECLSDEELEAIFKANSSAIDTSKIKFSDIYPAYISAAEIKASDVISKSDMKALAALLESDEKAEIGQSIDFSAIGFEDIYKKGYITIDDIKDSKVISADEIKALINDCLSDAEKEEIILGKGYTDIADVDFADIFPAYISAAEIKDANVIDKTDYNTLATYITDDEKVEIALDYELIDITSVADYFTSAEIIGANVITDKERETLAGLLSSEEKIELAIEKEYFDKTKLEFSELVKYISFEELKDNEIVTDAELKTLDATVFIDAGLTPEDVFNRIDNQAALAIELYNDGIIDLSKIDFELVADKLSDEDRTTIVEEIKKVDAIHDHVKEMIMTDIGILAHAVDIKQLYVDGIITDDMILDVISTEDIEVILDKKIVTADKIVANIKDMKALIDEIVIEKLPIDKILEVFPIDVLVDEVMAQNFNGLISALNLRYLINLEAVQTELKGLTVEDIKAIINIDYAKELLIAKVSKFVLSDLWAVSINGDDIDNVIFHNGSFDLAKFEKSLLDAIPTFDKIAAMGDDGEAASFVVHYMIKVGEEYKEYYNGFKIVFTGDTTAIKDYAAKMTEYVSFVVGDDGSITAKIGAPAKIAELYVSAIDSAKLPAALRAKLADIANIEFNKSDIGAFGDAIINKLTIAEIKDLLSSVDIKNIDDKILEQLDLRKSQVQLILDYATKAINKGVSIIETSPEIELTLGSFYDKTLADFYVGNGTFEFDFDISIDVMEKLDKIEKLPAEAKNLIKNATIAHSVNATIEINGLYEVEYVKGDEVIYTAYRTEGYDLGKVTANSAFAGLGANGWAGADAVAVTTMPAEDIQLAEIFNATFAAYDADGNLISETVIPFTQLSDVNSLLVAPSMPTIDGYIFIWDDINVVYDNFTVEGRYVETDDDVYTATFWDGSRVLFTLQYTAADVDNINIRSYLPAAPRGLMVSWNISKLPLRNVDVKLIRYTIEYTANFVDEDGTVIGAVPFNIYTSSIQTPTLPAVKGYTVEWESFKLIDDVRYNKTGSYSLTIKAVRTPITYNATFVDKDGKEIAKVPFTVAKHDIKAPEAPVLEGYNVTWPDFKDQILSEEIYEATGSYDFTVKAEYEAIEYTAKFVADGKVVAELPFTVETEALEAPAVPEKTGYTGEWAEYTLEAKDITIEAVYTVVEYKVTFMADGKEVAVLYYTVENKTITEPAVPEKAGFTGEWEEYTLDSGDKVVNAVYTENEPTPEDDTYYITFVDCNGNEIEKIPFTKGTDASTIKAPATVPEKAGYNVYWPSFTLFDDKRFEETGTYSFTVTAVYEAIEYTATFVADGKVIAEITFTVETDSIEAPAIPEKAGYTAVWSSYVLGTEDITIDAIYSTISYKVTFMADGKEVAVLYYTVEDPTIDEPAVPEKEGFKGAWEEYTLDSGDKVVNAVYTEIGGTSGASIFWWIIIGVLVVAAIAAVSVFFVMAKKKKDDEASAENK